MSGWRNIVVADKRYRWRMGRWNVVIRDADNKADIVPLGAFFPERYDLERARWKQYLHVTPSQIATYIEGKASKA